MEGKSGLIKGFKDMAAYLEQHAQIEVHPDTLRKAVGDERNPLRVEWEAGFAYIRPFDLMKWREGRKGMRRASPKCA